MDRVLYLGVIGFFIQFWAPQLHAEIVLACEQPQIPGLYKQCQEVTILQILGDHARVFSKVEKKVSLRETRALFVARSLSAKDVISRDQMISIPGNLVWNNTPDGFQSLCQVTGHSGAFLNVSCGRRQNETVKKQNVFVLSPFHSSRIQPTSFH